MHWNKRSAWSFLSDLLILFIVEIIRIVFHWRLRRIIHLTPLYPRRGYFRSHGFLSQGKRTILSRPKDLHVQACSKWNKPKPEQSDISERKFCALGYNPVASHNPKHTNTQGKKICISVLSSEVVVCEVRSIFIHTVTSALSLLDLF